VCQTNLFLLHARSRIFVRIWYSSAIFFRLFCFRANLMIIAGIGIYLLH
jgi:hypothetical protein